MNLLWLMTWNAEVSVFNPCDLEYVIVVLSDPPWEGGGLQGSAGMSVPAFSVWVSGVITCLGMCVAATRTLWCYPSSQPPSLLPLWDHNIQMEGYSTTPAIFCWTELSLKPITPSVMWFWSQDGRAVMLLTLLYCFRHHLTKVPAKSLFPAPSFQATH